MIQLADKETTPYIRQMWETCFDDTQAFVDFYFTEKYKEENTLVYFEDDNAVASLQMIPYQFTFCNIEIPISYISGACTYTEYRNKGYMGKLLIKAFEIMQQRNIPLSVLIPAEEWLYGYYAKYGFQTVFESDNKEIPLMQIIESVDGDINKAYPVFDSLFREKDFAIQKTKSDFMAIVKDAEFDDYPPKTNLSGMARIIDAHKLLTLFAEKYPDKKFSFALRDDLISDNNGFYEINSGYCKKINSKFKPTCFITPSRLCQLLFGFHLEEFTDSLAGNFVSHQPILNLMLE